MDVCPCGSTMEYAECCRPLISGEKRAETAEQVMRARYSAYVMKEMEYLRTSLHPDHRSDYDEKGSRAWAERTAWHGIEIHDTVKGGPDDSEGQVEFTASFTENGIRQEYRERSTFRKDHGIWYFETGKVLPPKPVVRTAPKAGRNDPCPCGSGRKFKKCCGQ
ncbi:MAG TPA: YchJ family protein [Nitrospirota bacterium]|nr:YchJ family protein [Nitrospirota bacterium]